MSKTIQEERERLAALNKQAKNLLAEKGSATWTKEDQEKFDALMVDAERIEQRITNLQKVLDQDAEKNFTDVGKFSNGPDKAKNEVMRGFELYLRKQDKHLTDEERVAVRNTMSTTTGSEGGFTVQTLVAKEFIDLLKSYAYMRKVASQISTENGADLSYPTSDGTSEIGELVAQNTTATAADPVFGSRALNAYKFSSKIVVVPIELLQDSQIDVVAMVMQRLRDRIGRIQNQLFTTGTGTAQPFGLTVAAGVGKTGTTGQTTTIIYDDLVDMVDSLDAAYLDVPASTPEKSEIRPGWMFGQAMRRVVRKLKDTAGRPLWTPSYDLGIKGAATPDELMGYPVYINNDMPAPAANAKSLSFGNHHLYKVRDAMEVTMFRFDDSAYMTKGQVAFLAWARAGGNLIDVNSVKTYQHSAT